MNAVIAPPEQILEQLRNRRMVILVDRGAPGDVGLLMLPAQFTGPDDVNFMAHHGRGIVILALSEARIAELRLPPMTPNNSAFHKQAFTVSIEARTGVTTGISSADRARTIQVAIDPAAGPDRIVTPGHIFPVAAAHDGVLARPGFAEGAIDLVTLAGLSPGATLCGILDDSGAMATMEGLTAFAATHGMKIGSIHDLVALRCRTEMLVDCTSRETFESEHGGEWELATFRNRIDGWEHLALLKGAPAEEMQMGGPVPTWIHSLSLLDDVLARRGDAAGSIGRTMQRLATEGSGLIILTRQPGKLFPAAMLQRESAPQPYPRPALGSFALAAQILRALDIRRISLLDPPAPEDAATLTASGIEIADG